jgi:hypothetical protein
MGMCTSLASSRLNRGEHAGDGAYRMKRMLVITIEMTTIMPIGRHGP